MCIRCAALPGPCSLTLGQPLSGPVVHEAEVPTGPQGPGVGLLESRPAFSSTRWAQVCSTQEMPLEPEAECEGLTLVHCYACLPTAGTVSHSPAVHTVQKGAHAVCTGAPSSPQRPHPRHGGGAPEPASFPLWEGCCRSLSAHPTGPTLVIVCSSNLWNSILNDLKFAMNHLPLATMFPPELVVWRAENGCTAREGAARSTDPDSPAPGAASFPSASAFFQLSKHRAHLPAPRSASPAPEGSGSGSAVPVQAIIPPQHGLLEPIRGLKILGSQG